MKKKEKLKKWRKEHELELALGAGAVLFAGIGGCVGYIFGWCDGYNTAASSMAKNIPGVVERLGKLGCFATMDMVKEEIPEAYKMIMTYCNTGTGARMDARTRFYNDPSIMEFLSDWKKLEKK